MARGRRDLGLERQWRERMAGWRVSEMNVREFCLRRGLTESTFYYWRDGGRAEGGQAVAMASISTQKAQPVLVPLVIVSDRFRSGKQPNSTAPKAPRRRCLFASGARRIDIQTYAKSNTPNAILSTYKRWGCLVLGVLF
jgi:hypothetical protein